MTQNAINSGYGTADGEILIGATGGRMLPSTLTAGSNVSIVNAANSITISSTGGSGGVVQQVRNSTASVVDCTTVIPFDNTIPQITEGTQVLTGTITPTNASSILVIQFNAWGYTESSNWTGALFQDATANALASERIGLSSTNLTRCLLTYYMTAGTTSATTFQIRIGPDSINRHYYVNGYIGGSSLYGDTGNAILLITEYAS